MNQGHAAISRVRCFYKNQGHAAFSRVQCFYMNQGHAAISRVFSPVTSRCQERL